MALHRAGVAQAARRDVEKKGCRFLIARWGCFNGGARRPHSALPPLTMFSATAGGCTKTASARLSGRRSPPPRSFQNLLGPRSPSFSKRRGPRPAPVPCRPQPVYFDPLVSAHRPRGVLIGAPERRRRAFFEELESFTPPGAGKRHRSGTGPLRRRSLYGKNRLDTRPRMGPRGNSPKSINPGVTTPGGFSVHADDPARRK